MRIVTDIGVAVEVLGIIRGLDKRVWGDESPKLWIVVPATIVVEAALWIKDLAGKKESL